jgi:hypothetical protein
MCEVGWTHSWRERERERERGIEVNIGQKMRKTFKKEFLAG